MPLLDDIWEALSEATGDEPKAKVAKTVMPVLSKFVELVISWRVVQLVQR
jgi:hypothetical protein